MPVRASQTRDVVVEGATGFTMARAPRAFTSSGRRGRSRARQFPRRRPRRKYLTSNLVFSEWDRIFKDPMTTAAAIDRLVHHAVILEMTGTSVRVEHAHSERAAQGELSTTTAPTTTAPTTTAPTTTTPTTTTPTTTTPTTTNPAIEGVKSATTTPSSNPAIEEAKPATTTVPPITPTTTKGAQTAATTRPPTRIKNREHSAAEPDGEM